MTQFYHDVLPFPNAVRTGGCGKPEWGRWDETLGCGLRGVVHQHAIEPRVIAHNIVVGGLRRYVRHESSRRILWPYAFRSVRLLAADGSDKIRPRVCTGTWRGVVFFKYAATGWFSRPAVLLDQIKFRRLQ
ncbi:Uncharacterised protein [Nocardia cyriacigeorgica]|uniref:Uncharacterized protein n=1 Tax=Nocardia cyriacigeorgica TaxID=135487 RepID=A0A4U8VXM8_9NOCA|nr:Uncharacterised protein [Nocardia cyriacigeorgica]